ncbi:MAG: hypothetical protein K2X48_02090 [Chitinophagaceae bacterium]|nr:hypothetical protein [Chitinophagaceae bacterium]
MRKLSLFILFNLVCYIFCIGQDSVKTKLFLRFSNFKPDFGFSTNESLDIPNNLNIMDADPTNFPGHSFEAGIRRRLSSTTFLTSSIGVLKATQVKSFLNYRSDADLQEFGFVSFYIIGQSYQHRRIFLNNSVQQFLFKGLFIEPGVKFSMDISSKKENIGHSFNTLAMKETYASTFYEIPRQSTNIILFYNLRVGYNYKSVGASFFYEHNFTKMERRFFLRGVEYIERQPFWKNVGFSLIYTFQNLKLSKQKI